MKAAEAVRKLHMEDKEVPDDIWDMFPIRKKIQLWAAQNAYTLVFLSLMFFITWGFLIALIVGRWHK
jgi:hypothetical protein